MCSPTRSDMTLRITAGETGSRDAEMLTDGALGMVRMLHHKFNASRRALLAGADLAAGLAAAEHTPAWRELLNAQVHLHDTISGVDDFDPSRAACLLPGIEATTIRPRRLEVTEPHVLVQGTPVAGALFDVGVFCHHNVRRLVAQGRTVQIQAPADAAEAQWWAEVVATIERWLEVPAGSIQVATPVEVAPVGGAVAGLRRSA